MRKPGLMVVIVAFLVIGIVQAVPFGTGDGFAGVAPAMAQDTNCPALVKSALAATKQSCTRTGRNKACYGNLQVKPEWVQAGATIKFDNAGDIVDIKDLKALTLAALDANGKVWGVALMRVQADLPDTKPEDNVTLLLFGNVSITDGSQAATAATPFPATQDASGAAPTPTSSKAYVFKPMQAFYFKSGDEPAACKEAPQDGVLIQTPKGKQKVTLVVNEARVEIGSTVFFQAQPGGFLVVNTLEGSAAVTVFGHTETATSGLRVRVPLDANLKASGQPLPPEPYNLAAMQVLPVGNMPLPVQAAVPPLPANAVATTWRITFGAPTGGTCAAVTPPPQTASVIIDPSQTMVWMTAPGRPTLAFSNDGSGTYSGIFGGNGVMSFKFLTATHGEGQFTGSGGSCTVTWPISLDKQGT